MPNTRAISNICSATYQDDNIRFTSMIVAFGQFVDHDLDHVPVPRSKLLLMSILLLTLPVQQS